MPNIIHETILRDIVDLIGDAQDFVDDGPKILGGVPGQHKFRSLTREANKLILVFPVLCTKGISIETASMLTKSIERYCVTLLQMLFASVQITDTASLTDYISRFHSNISIGDKITVDDFVAFTDSIGEAVEAGEIKVTDRAVYEQFQKGMKEFNCYINTYLNENALADYSCHRTYNGIETVLEGSKSSKTRDNRRKQKEREKRRKDKYGNEVDNDSSIIAPPDQPAYEDETEPQTDPETKPVKSPKPKNIKKNKPNNNSNNNNNSGYNENPREYSTRDRMDFINKLAENDVKKANELMPTKVIVDFYSSEAGTKLERGIIGVKCKLYTVDSMELIERIASKYADTNWVREFIRATTGEISFWRDFVFALDRARVDAINASRKGSSAKMWKVLERRATKNKLGRWKANRADSSPITTLIVSQEEVEYLKKEYDINLENRKIAMKLMEEYNFMGIWIADEPAETASFIWDEGNDAQYETLSFANLERESNDRDYKKVINLMTKLSR